MKNNQFKKLMISLLFLLVYNNIYSKETVSFMGHVALFDFQKPGWGKPIFTQKIEALEKRLSLSHKALNKTTDDMTHTIQNFQTEIQRLETENDRLKSKRGMYCTIN